MLESKKLLLKQHRQPSAEPYQPEVVIEMYQKIMKRINPLGLKPNDRRNDTSPLTDSSIRNITRHALRDNQWMKAKRYPLLQTIKGRPYCLQLGDLQTQGDNFTGFFQTFYTYQYQGYMQTPIVKPCGYNPLIKTTNLRARSKKSYRTISSTKQKQTLSKHLPTSFCSIDFSSKIKPKRCSKAYTAASERSRLFRSSRSLLNEQSLKQCNSLIQDCDRLLSDKFVSKVKKPRKRSGSTEIFI